MWKKKVRKWLVRAILETRIVEKTQITLKLIGESALGWGDRLMDNLMNSCRSPSIIQFNLKKVEQQWLSRGRSSFLTKSLSSSFFIILTLELGLIIFMKVVALWIGVPILAHDELLNLNIAKLIYDQDTN